MTSSLTYMTSLLAIYDTTRNSERTLNPSFLVVGLLCVSTNHSLGGTQAQWLKAY